MNPFSYPKAFTLRTRKMVESRTRVRLVFCSPKQLRADFYLIQAPVINGCMNLKGKNPLTEGASLLRRSYFSPEGERARSGSPPDCFSLFFKRKKPVGLLTLYFLLPCVSAGLEFSITIFLQAIL